MIGLDSIDGRCFQTACLNQQGSQHSDHLVNLLYRVDVHNCLWNSLATGMAIRSCFLSLMSSACQYRLSSDLATTFECIPCHILPSLLYNLVHCHLRQFDKEIKIAITAHQMLNQF